MLLLRTATTKGTGSCCQGGQGVSQAEEGLAHALVFGDGEVVSRKTEDFLQNPKDCGFCSPCLPHPPCTASPLACCVSVTFPAGELQLKCPFILLGPDHSIGLG